MKERKVKACPVMLRRMLVVHRFLQQVRAKKGHANSKMKQKQALFVPVGINKKKERIRAKRLARVSELLLPLCAQPQMCTVLMICRGV